MFTTPLRPPTQAVQEYQEGVTQRYTQDYTSGEAIVIEVTGGLPRNKQVGNQTGTKLVGRAMTSTASARLDIPRVRQGKQVPTPPPQATGRNIDQRSRWPTRGAYAVVAQTPPPKAY